MNVRVTPGLKQVGGSALLFSAGLFVVGCASPGTPKPPSLHLPGVVSDLTAERIGPTVRLRWTTPSKTTDGLVLNGPVTAQLCRRAVQADAACSPVRRLAVRSGPSELVDTLPVAMTSGAGTVLEYRVELLNTAERSAGSSTPVFTAGGDAPPSVVALLVEATPAGALLQWRPEDATDIVELERSQLSPAAKAGTRSVMVGAPAQQPTTIHLRADRTAAHDAPFTADGGGMVDATAARGETYVYTAQRVRRVVLASHAFELRSTASPPVTVTMRDVFPPQTPVGVEAIAGDYEGAPAIDLSWTPNTEEDLVGYLVYRRESDEAKEVQITPTLALQPAFRDRHVAPGRVYAYTVRAVDRTGNQSSPSAPARESIPLP